MSFLLGRHNQNKVFPLTCRLRLSFVEDIAALGQATSTLDIIDADAYLLGHSKYRHFQWFSVCSKQEI